MDLPDDKRQVVMGSSEEKKWQLVRDNTRRTRQHPPKEYLFKIRESTDITRKIRKKGADSTTIQALQGLEISLRTNNIRCISGNFLLGRDSKHIFMHKPLADMYQTIMPCMALF